MSERLFVFLNEIFDEEMIFSDEVRDLAMAHDVLRESDVELEDGEDVPLIYSPWMQELRTALTTAQRENQALRERVSAAEKDAARYRWFRNNPETRQLESALHYAGEMLDKVVDAALNTAAERREGSEG